MTGRRNPIDDLWAAPRGRIGLALLAFVLGISVASLAGSHTEDSSSDVVVILGSLRFPAMVVGLLCVLSVRFHLRRVHWIAGAVALICVSLQALVSTARGLEQRGLEDAVDGPAGWAFVVIVAVALVPLFAPAERVGVPAAPADADAERTGVDDDSADESRQ